MCYTKLNERRYLMKNLIFIAVLLLLQNFVIGQDLKGELIFTPQDKHTHSSSIVETSAGNFLVCWFHGSGERKANDVVVNGARLKKGSNKWSPIFLMADTPNLPDCNPVLFIDKQKKLWLFWIAVVANRWERSLLMYKTSTNYDGKGVPQWDWQGVITLQPGDKFPETIEKGFKELQKDEPIWSEYAPLFTEMTIAAAKDPVKRQTGWMMRTHPLTLPGGRIILPIYSDGYNLSMVAYSDDAGKTWQTSKPMVGFGPNQPSILRKNDGTLVAYFRDDGSAPMRVLISTSKDNGESWSWAVDTDIPNPSSSLEVIRLKDGRWVMVFNDTEDTRSRLAVAMSDDEGLTWKWKKHLEDGKGSFSYPSGIQAANGLIHVTYSYVTAAGKESIKHVSFPADWIKK